MDEGNSDLIHRGSAERWLPWVKWTLIAYWLVLFVATHTPQMVPLPEVDHADKYAHFAAYAVLALLCGLYAGLRWGPGLGQALVMAVILIAYAMVDELLQIPVGRNFDLRDWVADTVGVLIAVALLLVLTPLATRLGGRTTAKHVRSLS